MIRSPVRPPASPVAITGRLEALQRARDVDALAARRGQAGARPVPMPELEVRHRQRAIDCGVEGDGDDHEKMPGEMMHGPGRRTTVAARRGPGAERPAPATSGRVPSSVLPAQTSIRPSGSPRATGSETAVGATIRSTSGRPTRTTRTSGFRATSGNRVQAVRSGRPRVRLRATSVSVRYCDTPQASSRLSRRSAAHASGCRGSPRRSCSPCRRAAATSHQPASAV